LKNKRPTIKRAEKESGRGIESLRDEAKLVKFFEVLMEIDERQKRNKKNG
jgi:hypothetical protein